MCHACALCVQVAPPQVLTADHAQAMLSAKGVERISIGPSGCMHRRLLEKCHFRPHQKCLYQASQMLQEKALVKKLACSCMRLFAAPPACMTPKKKVGRSLASKHLCADQDTRMCNNVYECPVMHGVFVSQNGSPSQTPGQTHPR
jgi:hypothetical protein